MAVVPDYCLVRFLDVTVKPGETYEYRVAVKMANPLYKRDELAVAQQYTLQQVIAGKPQEVAAHAGDKEPLQFRVPDEGFYYAVDEKPEGVPFVTPANQEKAALQIHRWLEQVQVNPGNKDSTVPVGEWSILERLLVKRGEFIGTVAKVEIPIWDPAQEAFVMATAPDTTGPRSRALPQKGVPVDFSTDALLVDFEGGGKVPAEMLILTPDGKLVVRDGRIDSDDADRKQRVQEWKERLNEVKKPGNKAKGGDQGFFPGGK